MNRFERYPIVNVLVPQPSPTPVVVLGRGENGTILLGCKPEGLTIRSAWWAGPVVIGAPVLFVGDSPSGPVCVSSDPSAPDPTDLKKLLEKHQAKGEDHASTRRTPVPSAHPVDAE